MPTALNNMRKHAALFILLISLTVGFTSYGVAWVVGGGEPTLEAPAAIDLGTQSDNAVAAVTFGVHNTGSEVLELSDVASSCGCLSLEVEGVDGPEQFRHASVRPGQGLYLQARLLVHAVPGNQFRGSIRFRTNDPKQHEARVEIVANVQGHIVASPAELILVSIRPGQSVTQRVELRDTGLARPCVFSRVESSDPEHLRAGVPRPLDRVVDPSNPRLGKAVGEIEVHLHAPNNPCTLAGELRVFTDGATQPRLTIPVRMAVVPAVQLLPSSLTLPRASGDGTVYTARCLCRSSDGKPLMLTATDVPPGLRVNVEKNSGQASACVLNIEWRPVDDPRAEPRERKVVRLLASVDGVAEVLELPVTCVRSDG